MAEWIAPDLPVAALSDEQIVVCTVYGEARAEPSEGQIAVAWVIRHRQQAKPGATLTGVCLAPWQFSCWNPAGGAKNAAVVAALVRRMAAGEAITDPAAVQTAFLVHGVLKGYLPDPVKGATHYHTVSLQPRPKWAQAIQPIAQKGSHLFYAGVK